MDDLLVQTFDDYKLKTADLIIAAGNSVALPSDYYKIRGADIIIDSVQPYSIRPFNFPERNRYANTLFRGTTGPFNAKYRVQDGYLFIEPVTAASGTYTIWYTPLFVNFTLATDTLPTYMDVQSWSEYITLDCCIKVKIKLELDPQAFMMLKEPMRMRILTMSKGRAQAEGKTVSAVRQETDDMNNWFGVR